MLLCIDDNRLQARKKDAELRTKRAETQKAHKETASLREVRLYRALGTNGSRLTGFTVPETPCKHVAHCGPEACCSHFRSHTGGDKAACTCNHPAWLATTFDTLTLYVLAGGRLSTGVQTIE